MTDHKLTDEQLKVWANTYPRPLEYDFGPFGASLNDFTLGNWPDSIVARKGDYDTEWTIKKQSSQTPAKILIDGHPVTVNADPDEYTPAEIDEAARAIVAIACGSVKDESE